MYVRGLNFDSDLFRSPQPQFVKSDLPIVERMLGAERAETSYAWRSLREEGGVVLVGGSDAPVRASREYRGSLNVALLAR